MNEGLQGLLGISPKAYTPDQRRSSMPDMQRQSPAAHESPMALVMRDKSDNPRPTEKSTSGLSAQSSSSEAISVMENRVEAHSGHGHRSPGGRSSSGCCSSQEYEEEKPLDLVVKEHVGHFDSGLDDTASDHSDATKKESSSVLTLTREESESKKTMIREEIRPQVTLAKVMSNMSSASLMTPPQVLKIRDFARLETCRPSGVSDAATPDEQSVASDPWRERSNSSGSSSKKSSNLTLETERHEGWSVANLSKPAMSMPSTSSGSGSGSVDKPFVCGVCHKAYARKSHLHVHYRVHTGERPYVCKTCGRDFTEKRFLNDHIQTAHTGRDGPLTCPNCGREFAYKTSLKQHLKKQMCAKNLHRDALFNNGNGNNNGMVVNNASVILLGNNNGNNGNNNGNNNGGNNGGNNVSMSSSSSAPSKQFPCPFCDKSYSWKQTLKQHVSMYHRNKVHTDEFWRYELVKHRRVSDATDNKANDELWQKQIARHTNTNAIVVVNDTNNNNVTNNNVKESSAETTSVVENSNSCAMASKLLALHKWQSGLFNLASKSTKESQQPPKTIVLPNLKEESAATRTQMWLAQLGHYQEQSIQDEMERSHDELWEQQIARIKSKPVKSPLEPLEISLDDDDDAGDKEDEEKEKESKRMEETKSELKTRHVVPMMSALQLHSMKMAAAAAAAAAASAASASSEPGPMRKRSRTSLSEELYDGVSKEEKRKDSRSFLKSLLLDCFDEDEYEAKRQAKNEEEEEEEEEEEQSTSMMSSILGKQLMGLDDQTKAYKSYHVGPATTDTDSAKSSGSVVNEKISPKSSSSASNPPPPLDYARTSVLKHLLHRYNADNADKADCEMASLQ